MHNESVVINREPQHTGNVVTRSFHLSLNVRDLENSIRFFEIFLGTAPAKHRPDYAKFELQDPPLVLSLEPSGPTSRGVLNHVGIRMPSSEALVEMQRRLELGGIATQRLDGVECCYARQTKFWLRDPDGTLWEVYTLEADIDHHGDDRINSSMPASELDRTALPVVPTTPTPPRPAAPAVWSHTLGQPIPEKLFVRDHTIDEIQLQGTFNAASTVQERKALLAECLRGLKPDGELQLHQLTSDRDISAEKLDLPGAAAIVEQVLPIDQLIAELEAAGFSQVEFTKYGSRPCFVVEETELRETLLVARPNRPQETDANASQCRVLFKGPADQVIHAGTALVRGQITEVTRSQLTQLREVLGDQLIVFGAAR